MSDQISISVKDLKKDFYLSHSGINSLKSLVVSKHHAAVKKLEVLRGISFDVARGECLAIVGRNGAGKSTLLSLLSRIYRPTSGEVRIFGRVAPLLELGSGFHPELTGFENIIVNGLILGFSKKEITKTVDEIVAFSELEQYIDAPTRTYSTGMQARLGFAIAVHVGAEILFVDEVLAVGDYDFREKCSNKVDELRKEGRTIVVVSHVDQDVVRLADRCIWLQQGLVQMEGDPNEVLTAYTKGSVSSLAESRQV